MYRPQWDFARIQRYITKKSEDPRTRSKGSIHEVDRAVQRVDDFDGGFVGCEEDPATEHRPSQTHSRSSPKPSDTVVDENALHGFGGTGTTSTLRPCLDDVKGLGAQGGDHACDGAICEVRGGVLWNVTRFLVIFQDIVRAHAERSSRRLLKSRADKSPVEAQNAMLFPDSRRRVPA